MQAEKNIARIYPRTKVIDGYASLGGTIGGSIIALSGLAIFLLTIDSLELGWLVFSIFLAMITVALGFIIGMLPALLAAHIICKFEMYFDSILKIVPLFAIGFLSTFICVIWLPVADNLIARITYLLPFEIIGGFSAVVTGWFVLPKHKQ